MFPLLVLIMLTGAILIVAPRIISHGNNSRLNLLQKLSIGSGAIMFAGSIFFMDTAIAKIPKQKPATHINGLESLENGTYASLGIYNHPSLNGKWLAILHPTKIVRIDADSRTVATVNVGDYPFLVQIDYPISAPQNRGGTNKFTGLAEVGTNNMGKFIRDYNPPFSPPR